MARLCDLGLTERIKEGMDNDCFKWKDGMSEEMFLNSAEGCRINYSLGTALI